MSTTDLPTVDSTLDLVLERVLAAPVDRVWRALTTPEQLKQWFVPRPWQLADCEVDLRPGGIFRTVMRGPEGEEFDSTGCFLDVVPQARLVHTGVLGPDFRPKPVVPGAPEFTAVISLTAVDGGTRYRAHVMHRSTEDQQAHSAMGFHEGWGATLDQMVELLQASA
jgi:uncharacterized protein YndB with AHSA1/START domain